MSARVEWAMLRRSWVVASLLLLAACGPRAEAATEARSPNRAASPAAPTTFPAATTTTFGKTACSPALPPKIAEGFVIDMPAKITWGEPLPICGYLRVGEELRIKYPRFDLVLERKDRGLDRYRTSETQELGEPMMDRFSPAYELLKRQGELYFVANGQHRFRDLSPGEYDIELGYLGELHTEKKHLVVVAGGWRKELSDALTSAICEEKLLEDLSGYLDAMHHASLVDSGPQGTAGLERAIEAAWRAGFAKHRAKVSDPFRAQLESFDASEHGVAFYVYSRVRSRCASRPIEVGTVLSVLEGLRRYVGPPGRAVGTSGASSPDRP